MSDVAIAETFGMHRQQIQPALAALGNFGQTLQRGQRAILENGFACTLPPSDLIYYLIYSIEDEASTDLYCPPTSITTLD